MISGVDETYPRLLDLKANVIEAAGEEFQFTLELRADAFVFNYFPVIAFRYFLADTDHDPLVYECHLNTGNSFTRRWGKLSDYYLAIWAEVEQRLKQ